MASANHITAPYRGQTRRILVPSGFDPMDHLPRRLEKHAGRVMAFAHLLTIRDRWPPKDYWWVPFHINDIRTLFGRYETWYAVRDALCDTGAIECDGIAIPGVRPTGYRLAHDLRIKTKYGHDLADTRAVAALDILEPRVRGEAEPVHYHNLMWLERTSFDIRSAAKMIGRYGGKRRRRAEFAMRWFATGVHRPKVGTTGRLFSAVTSMPRRLRPFIRIDGHPVVCADVSNAQPLALGLMAVHGRKFTHAFAGPATGGGETDGILRVMFTDSDICHTNLDTLDYLENCQNGGFYPAFADAVGLPCRTTTERNRVKRTCFWMMMGNPDDWSARGRTRWDGFCARWPTVAGVLDDLKRDDHCGAARALQGAEAYLMVREFGSVMMDNQPDAPMLMIHDAVMTTEEWLDRVRSAIVDVWGRWGVRPNLKVS